MERYKQQNSYYNTTIEELKITNDKILREYKSKIVYHEKVEDKQNYLIDIMTNNQENMNRKFKDELKAILKYLQKHSSEYSPEYITN